VAQDQFLMEKNIIVPRMVAQAQVLSIGMLYIL